MAFFSIPGWSILSCMPKATRPNPDAMIFGAILRQLRTNRGWTIRTCAQRLGIHPTYLGVVEAGGNMPSVPLLLEVADVFNIEPSAIMRAFEEERKAQRAATPAGK